MDRTFLSDPKTSKVVVPLPLELNKMTEPTTPPRVDAPHKQVEDEPDKIELRKRLLDMIKREEMIRREKPR